MNPLMHSCRIVTRAAMLAGLAALAGCSAQLPDLTQFKLPQPRNFLPSNSGTYVPPA